MVQDGSRFSAVVYHGFGRRSRGSPPNIAQEKKPATNTASSLHFTGRLDCDACLVVSKMHAKTCLLRRLETGLKKRGF
jgi:hypothetical protein